MTSLAQQQVDDLQRERDLLLAQIEEDQWLRDTEGRAARPRSARIYKTVTLITFAYLTLNAVSVRTPGPAKWLGLAPHIHLIAHLARLF